MKLHRNLIFQALLIIVLSTTSTWAQDKSANEIPSDSSSPSYFLWKTNKLTIVDSLAILNTTEKDKIALFFFTQPLTHEQKQAISADNSPILSLYGLIGDNFPVFSISLKFKNSNRECSMDALNDFGIKILDKNGGNLSMSAMDISTIRQLSCSFTDDPKVSIILKDNPSDNRWGVEATMPLVVPVPKGDDGYVVSVSAEELVHPPVIMGSFLLFYSKYGRAPQNSDIEELKTLGSQMANGNMDQYEFVDVQPQPDGGVKIMYKSKNSDNPVEAIFSKPSGE